jgi:DNA-binding transcriptional LysR family regulator
MTDLNEIASFVAVVRHAGFTAAAKELQEPKSTLSRRVSQLEKRLGVNLIIRTTRSIRLTDAGKNFYNECSRILGEMQEAEKLIAPHQQAAEGVVRITAPVEIGAHQFPPLLKEFSEKYPKIQIEVDLSDRYVDMLREGFDIALRAGNLKDSSLMAKKLGTGCFALFASPGYLKKFGTPKIPKEVEDHRCIVFSPEFREIPWQLNNENRKEKILPHSHIRVNSFTMAKNLAINDLGICYGPISAATEEIKNKKLVQVLPEWTGEPRPYSLVYPPAKLHPLRVKLLLDFLYQKLKI